MPTFINLLLYALWIAWLTQAIISALQVYRFGRRLRKPTRPSFTRYKPAASIIVPIKGLDDDLPAAIAALCQQDYENYEILFVVESQTDPAYAVIEQQRLLYPHRPSQLIVAGLSDGTTSQKVFNQLTALEILEKKNEDDRAWVFADADAVPGPNWLSEIVGPLCVFGKTGMSSGYRWLIPTANRAGNVSIWSHLASVCNSSAACQLGEYFINHAWGGAMAINAGVAQKGPLRQYLLGAITDDHQMTRMCQDMHKRIAFVPHCLVPSPVDFDCKSFFNFAFRQHLITRVCLPGLYWTSLLLFGLYTLGFVTAWSYLLCAWLTGLPLSQWWLTGTIVVCVGLLNQLRASLRKWSIEPAFDLATRQQLRKTFLVDRWLTPVWMLLHLAIILRAGLGRQMTWRGITYDLRGPQNVRRVD